MLKTRCFCSPREQSTYTITIVCCRFVSSHFLPSPFFNSSLILTVEAQIRDQHSRLFSPLPIFVRFALCIFIAKILQPFLPSANRVEFTYATRPQQLVPSYFFFNFLQNKSVDPTEDIKLLQSTKTKRVQVRHALD